MGCILILLGRMSTEPGGKTNQKQGAGFNPPRHSLSLLGMVLGTSFQRHQHEHHLLALPLQSREPRLGKLAINPQDRYESRVG